jgi:predicted metalloprotease
LCLSVLKIYLASCEHNLGCQGFEGTTAYGAAHEMKHLQKKEEKGRRLWEFKFRIK